MEECSWKHCLAEVMETIVKISNLSTLHIDIVMSACHVWEEGFPTPAAVLQMNMLHSSFSHLGGPQLMQGALKN
jgi:hypothetical protein